MTVTAVLALAASCQSLVAPTTILKIAQHESGLDPSLIHQNRDGSRDRGLMQINDRNDAFLGLTNPLDPCQSIHAAADLLASFSRYNTGSPTRGIANGYAVAVQAVRVADDPKPPESVVISPGDSTPPATSADACSSPAWDVWAEQDCNDHPKPEPAPKPKSEGPQ